MPMTIASEMPTNLATQVSMSRSRSCMSMRREGTKVQEITPLSVAVDASGANTVRTECKVRCADLFLADERARLERAAGE